MPVRMCQNGSKKSSSAKVLRTRCCTPRDSFTPTHKHTRTRARIHARISRHLLSLVARTGKLDKRTHRRRRRRNLRARHDWTSHGTDAVGIVGAICSNVRAKSTSQSADVYSSIGVSYERSRIGRRIIDRVTSPFPGAVGFLRQF
jgi:hypothetical protein